MSDIQRLIASNLAWSADIRERDPEFFPTLARGVEGYRFVPVVPRETQELRRGRERIGREQRRPARGDLVGDDVPGGLR
jgi:hypothetical protein